MKRLTAWIALLAAGMLVLAACGGGETPGTAGGSTGGSASGGSVTGGASGIKDAAILGKWISADGGYSYNFADDFTVVVTNVGAESKEPYNIVEGGNGQGKIEIAENNAKVVWDYKISDTKLDMTTPDGRSRKLSRAQ